MKKQLPYLLMVLLLFDSLLLIAQQHKSQKLDSLLKIYNSEKYDTFSVEKKTIILNTLSYLYLDMNPSMTVPYAQSSLELSRKHHNQKGMSYALNMLGSSYFFLGEYDKSISYFIESLEILKQEKDSSAIAGLMCNIATIHGASKNWNKCLDYNYQALAILEKLKDKGGIARVFNNIGMVHENQNNLDTALYYYNMSLELKRELNNVQNLALALNNIGLIYLKKEDLSKALTYFEEALDLRIQIQDQYGIASTLNNLADICIAGNDFPKALEYLYQSEKTGDSLNLRDVLKETYFLYSSLYEKKRSYLKALNYYKLYDIQKDSLFNTEKNKKISELQIQYEVLEKDKENEILKNENLIKDLKLKKQKVKQFFFAILSLLVFSILIILYLLLKKSRILNKKLLLEIELRQQAEEELKTINENLEQMNADLERMNQLYVGREHRIHELKEKIKELEK
jgi:tetratricopeptide (TPR) repeat protein